VTNRKDQGRYARMVAFWGLVLLVAYGCFRGGGLVTVLDGWMGDSNATYVDPFPLLGSLKTSTLLALGVLFVHAVFVHKFLGSPKVDKTLTETELEMQKVTWPTWPDTWNGTVAVAFLVGLLLVFLALVDFLLVSIMRGMWGGGVA
jgi:preprotein translocase SecE subunit